MYQAQVEAAQGRVELAQLDLDRCTLRAPFSGRIVDVPVCTGQYVLRGAVIVELADVSSLRVIQPVDRRSVAANASFSVQVEGRDVPAKVQAVLPLPESLKVLRELATPLSAAMLVVPNSKGDLEPGQRVQSGTVPSTPTAIVPKRAVRPEDPRGGDNMMVQVIRDDYVTNVPVRVLGDTGSERVQIAGALRTSDSLITSSSVPLLAGTLVRFGDSCPPQAQQALKAASPARPPAAAARRSPPPRLPQALADSGPQREIPAGRARSEPQFMIHLEAAFTARCAATRAFPHAKRATHPRAIPTNKSHSRANLSETTRPGAQKNM